MYTVLVGLLKCVGTAVLISKAHLVTRLRPVMKRFLTRETGAFALKVVSGIYLRISLDVGEAKCD